MELMNLIITSRGKLNIKNFPWKCKTHSNIFFCKININCLNNMRLFVEEGCNCKSIYLLCDNCLNFIKAFDFLCAKNILSNK